MRTAPSRNFSRCSAAIGLALVLAGCGSSEQSALHPAGMPFGRPYVIVS